MKTFGKNRRKIKSKTKMKRKMVGGEYTDVDLGYIDGALQMVGPYGQSPVIQEYLKGLELREEGCFGFTSYFSGTKCSLTPEYKAAFKEGRAYFALNDGTPPKHGSDLIGKIIEFSEGDKWINYDTKRKWRHPDRETWVLAEGYKAGYIHALETGYPSIIDDLIDYYPKILGILNGEGEKCETGCKKNPEYKIGYDRGRRDATASKGVGMTTPPLDPNVIKLPGVSTGNTRIAPPQFGEEEISEIIMNSYSLWLKMNWVAPGDEKKIMRTVPTPEQINNWIPLWFDEILKTRLPDIHATKTNFVEESKKKNAENQKIDKENKKRNEENQKAADEASEQIKKEIAEQSKNKPLEKKKELTYEEIQKLTAEANERFKQESLAYAARNRDLHAHAQSEKKVTEAVRNLNNNNKYTQNGYQSNTGPTSVVASLASGLSSLFLKKGGKTRRRIRKNPSLYKRSLSYK